MNGTPNSKKEGGETQKSLMSSQKLTEPSTHITITTQNQLQQIPLPDRLSTKTTHTKLDEIRAKIPRPRASVPYIYLPAWQTLPLDSKLPSLPGGALFFTFSRGQIGDSLARRGRHFDTSDLRNASNTYTALHDPHAKLYLKKPHVKCLLQQQGLITNCDEVLCSQKDFNAFRSSLACEYNHKIKDILHQQDKQAKSDRDLLRRIKEYERRNVPQDILYECLALFFEDTELLDEYIGAPKNKPQPKKSVVDWRKRYKFDPQKSLKM